MSFRQTALIAGFLAVSIGMTGCGTSKTERALSGGAIGAGAGAVGSTLTGGSPWAGAAIGGAAGAATGALTRKDQIDLGD